MKNDYSYSITEIRNVVQDIRENQEWFDDSYYVEKLVNIMEREKEFVVQMIRNKEEHKKILKENPKLLRTKSVFSHAFESLNDEFEKGVIKGRLEAIPITRELVMEEKLQKDLAICFIAFGIALLTLTVMGVAVAITLAIK